MAPGEKIARSESAKGALKAAVAIALQLCGQFFPGLTHVECIDKLKEGVQSVGWTDLDKSVTTIPFVGDGAYTGKITQAL